MNKDPLADALRAIEAGMPVDWGALEREEGDESFRLVTRDLKILSDITTFHRALHESEAPSAADELPQDAAAEALGTWGLLSLLERIGRGSFGEVYRAWDRRLDREVALKLLRRPKAPHDSVGSAVVEEGRLLARIRHPNVITVYGADRIDGRVGLWMEFVHGRTLERVLRDHGPLGAHEAMLIGLDLCRALSAVHKAGLVHRDVKGQNVMREAGGRIVLMDFGAGRDHPESEQEGSGQPTDLAGTPLYLAPEVFDHRPADTRADIYSVGVLLYHLVTGSYPVEGETFSDIRQAHQQGNRTLLRDERPDLPDAFVKAVERALDRDPLRRFESAGAMEAALSNALTVGDAAATPLRRLLFIVAAGLAAAATALIALNVGGWRERLFGAGSPSQPGAAHAAAGGAGSLVVRQVLLPGEYTWLGRPSLDGRYYPFVNADGNLAVKEIATGTVHVLTARGKSAESAVVESAISPDGKWVAYSWEALDGAVEMRAIGIDGSWPRVLLRRADVDVPHAIEWSQDGTAVLSQLEMKNGTYQMAMVDTSTNTVRTLKDFGSTRSLRISLSPDGRFVADHRPQRPDRPMRDIFILATDGSGEWPLVQHPSNDLFPQWSPDGNGIIFASDRTGSLGLWMVRVAEGRAFQEPQLLSRDMGHMDPLGITHDGTLYYHLQTGLVDVYTASISPSTGTVIAKPEPVAPNYIGSNISSGWSSDARQLAYVSIKSPAGSDRFSRMLAIRETDSGEQRDLWPALAFFMGPSWSPDGRSLLVRGVDLQGRCCIHQIDVDSGRVSPAIVQERVPDAEGIDQQAWTPDGKGILYARGSKVIMSRNLTTGADATLLDIRSVGVDRLTPGGNGNPTFEISPDGRSIAFSGWIGTGAEARSVIDVLPFGGTAMEILRAPEPLLFQGWTPDGLDLLFLRPKSDGDDVNALWRIPAGGGQPRPVGLEMVGLRDVHLSPDGKGLTFTAGWQTGDVRMMENFLPR